MCILDYFYLSACAYIIFPLPTFCMTHFIRTEIKLYAHTYLYLYVHVYMYVCMCAWLHAVLSTCA